MLWAERTSYIKGALLKFISLLIVKGFDAIWIQWVNGCVIYPKFPIFINGKTPLKVLTKVL